MDADVGELACDLEFLFKGECYPRGLFSVPERGIKNSNFSTAMAIGEEGNPPQRSCESYPMVRTRII
jgi:hypothetical protein